MGNGTAFRKGRDLAAWLGLVPRQHSTGSKARLLGISKRGDPYLRRFVRSRWPRRTWSGQAGTTSVWRMAGSTRSPLSAQRGHCGHGEQDRKDGVGGVDQRSNV
ncbi:MAG: transposase [Janthinobacterium lividum]